MQRAVAALAALVLALAPAAGDARGHGGGRSYRSSHSSSTSHATGTHSSGSNHRSSAYTSRSRKAAGVQRDSHGKIKRDPEQRRAFMRQHPCPSTGKTSGACPGYVVDHVKPLKGGGADSPSNMQWQTVSAAKAKDKWE